MLILTFTFLAYNFTTYLPFSKWGKSSEYLSFIKIAGDQKPTFYVDRTEAPYIRYLFEFNHPELRDKFNYPSNFTFQPLTKHSDWIQNAYSLAEVYRNIPKMNELLNYDILITPELNSLGNNDKWTSINGTSNFFQKKERPN